MLNKNQSNYKLLLISPSNKPEKKLMAIFEHEDTKRTKTVHFGAKGMSDYTKHKDEIRKANYLKRHQATEDWDNFITAGSLSRWILWNKPTLSASIKDYKQRFQL